MSRDTYLRGTLAPFFRASDRPMAIACLRLLTRPPFPDFKVPCFLQRMALLTLFPAAFPYRGMLALLRKLRSFPSVRLESQGLGDSENTKFRDAEKRRRDTTPRRASALTGRQAAPRSRLRRVTRGRDACGGRQTKLNFGALSWHQVDSGKCLSETVRLLAGENCESGGTYISQRRIG